MKIIDKLSSNVKRALVRAQPYLPDVKTDILRNSLKDFSNSGAYGVIFEGMKYYKKPLKCKYELEKIGADYCYNKDLLKSHFLLFKEKAHELNLKFYCGENRLRALGDSLCCCGVSDLSGFEVNEYNCNHLLNGDIKQPTGTMCKPGTGRIIHIMDQGCGTYEAQKKMTFKDFILSECYEPRTFKSLGK